MSTKKLSKQPKGRRHVYVVGTRRAEPDLRKLARALIELARVQLEAETQTDHAHRQSAPKAQPPDDPRSAA